MKNLDRIPASENLLLETPTENPDGGLAAENLLPKKFHLTRALNLDRKPASGKPVLWKPRIDIPMARQSFSSPDLDAIHISTPDPPQAHLK